MKKLIKIGIISFLSGIFIGLCGTSEKYYFSRTIIIIIAGFGFGYIMSDFSAWFERKFKK